MKKPQIHKFLSKSGFIRASALVCPEVVNEMRENQQTSPPSTMALGRSFICTALMASHLKDGQAISAQFICEGPMRMLFAQASYEGACRAYIAEPQLPMSLKKGKLSLAPHVGAGTLTVSTYIKGNTQPQRSQVLIQTGEVTEDLAHYILTSQQLPCMLSTGVLLGSEGVVTNAGGILVEMMPGHREEDIKIVENCFKVMGSLSDVLTPEMTGGELLEFFFVGVEGQHWRHDYNIELSCSCTYEKVLNSLQLLGKEDLEDMISKKEMTDISCQMCGKRYQVDVEQLQKLLQELKGLH